MNTENSPQQYAQQTLFSYGWDYVGSDGEGKRLLFDTPEEAQSDLDHEMIEMKHMGYNPEEWRVVPYMAADDEKNDLS